MRDFRINELNNEGVIECRLYNRNYKEKSEDEEPLP
jgi:hypothetical protein